MSCEEFVEGKKKTEKNPGEHNRAPGYTFFVPESYQPKEASTETIPAPLEKIPALTQCEFENGLPGFPEVTEAVVHHIETVAGATVLWFSNETHALDYAVIDNPDEFRYSTSEGSTSEQPQESELASLLNPENRIVRAFDITSFSDRQHKDFRAVLGIMEDLGLSGSTTRLIDQNLPDKKGSETTETYNWSFPPEAQSGDNYQATPALKLLEDLLAAAPNPEQKATIAKLLRALITREKFQQRQVEVVPPELTYAALADNPNKTEALRTWAANYASSAMRLAQLPMDEAAKVLCALPEDDANTIISPEYLKQYRGPELLSSLKKPPKTARSLYDKQSQQHFVTAVMHNLHVFQRQTKEALSQSPTFQQEQFHDPYFNPNGDPAGRTAPETDAFGSLLVAIQGEQPAGEAPPVNTKYSELIGHLIDTEFRFYLNTPSTKKPYSHDQPTTYGVEMRCPRTRNADEILKFLTTHHNPEAAAFFQQLAKDGHMSVSGDHYLRICILPSLDRQQSARELSKIDKKDLKLYNNYMQPCKLLGMLGAFAPESSQVPLYKIAAYPKTFAGRRNQQTDRP